MNIDTVAPVVFLVILVLLPFIFIKQWRDRQKQQSFRHRLHQFDEKEVVLKFTLRMKRAIWFGLAPTVSGFAVVFAAVGWKTGKIAMEQINVPWFVLGFILIFFGIAFLSFAYRCPVCGAIPTEGPHGVFDLNPTSCSQCGVRLQ